ncbi:MAG TPA: glycoside hydrolase family 27 protein [Terriglobia bacterium]|nr:glycoside hydrolase family 27 protein [Terriglobia bacterium]
MLRKLFRLLMLVLFSFVAMTGLAQPSELARTPPMGWNTWNHFHLNINDAIVRAQAEALVDTGLKAAGYEYAVIDGGWEGYHDAQGLFEPNILKFPDMKALCDYIHSLGLKVGIHTSPGPVTCSGREASYGHEQQDAETFARWGIDFVKYDWCSGSMVYKPDQMRAAYEKFHQALLRTGRPILFSLCEYGMQDVWKWGPSVGASMWRTTGDIQNNYLSMSNIGFEQNGLEKYARPGHWNDPDMLEVGNGGMPSEEYRTQMSLWSLLAAPLFASNDLTSMTPETLAILTNREVIAVNQDPAGIQGHRVWEEGPLEIWMKPLADGSKAVGLFNRDEHEMTMTLNFKDIGITRPAKVRDLWAHKDLDTFKGNFTTSVPRHGVVMLRVEQ